MLNVTPNAVNHIKEMISSRGKNTLGIKVGINTKGCSGLSYTMEFVDQIDDSDEMIVIDDVKIFIDKKASLFLIGTISSLVPLERSKEWLSCSSSSSSFSETVPP